MDLNVTDLLFSYSNTEFSSAVQMLPGKASRPLSIVCLISRHPGPDRAPVRGALESRAPKMPNQAQ